MGAPGSSGQNNTNPSGTNPGTMSPNSTGTMPGSSAGMNDNMSGGAGKVSAEDKSFMKEAMEGDMAEIQLAKLAQQKASSDQVKQFAQRMIDDHTKLDAQMKPMAQQFGVEAPTDLSSKHKSVQSKLQGLSGNQFDQEYIKAMVNDHREDDQAFLREQTTAKDPTLKSAVTQAEPIIADHLRMAQDIEKSMKGKGSSM
jgi:putative membrane protein